MILPSVVIRSLGSYKPKKVLTNNDLSKIVETSDEWIQTRSGIHERRIAEEEETASSMAVEAAKNALKQAQLAPEKIDLLIVATMTPDMLFPATACIVQAKLGLRCIMAFDVSAACSGFLYALETANHMLKSGRYRHALVIGTEKISSIIDWQDRTTCVLFGDGAGAVVLSKTDTPQVGILDSILFADGSNASLLYMPGGGSACPASQKSLEAQQHFLKMNGKELFKYAVRNMEQACLKILENNGLQVSDIQCIIPHQANIRIIQSLAERLNIPMERFFINIESYGNTSAASIPIALDEAFNEGKIKSGDKILLVAFGAGLTWGATLLQWH